MKSKVTLFSADACISLIFRSCTALSPKPSLNGLVLNVCRCTDLRITTATLLLLLSMSTLIAILWAYLQSHSLVFEVTIDCHRETSLYIVGGHAMTIFANVFMVRKDKLAIKVALRCFLSQNLLVWKSSGWGTVFKLVMIFKHSRRLSSKQMFADQSWILLIWKQRQRILIG